MTTLPSPLCTRKEIAQYLKCSPRQVKRNEKRWGLINCRADFNGNEVRYKTFLVVTLFQNRGWILKASRA